MLLIELGNVAAEPVTVQELKTWARIERADEDALFATLLASAREHVERQTGRVFARRLFRLVAETVPADGLLAPGRGPIRRVTEVRFYDETGRERIEAGGAAVTAEGEAVRLLLPFPAGGSVEIEFEAGEDVVPDGLRQAILRIAASSYETRGLVGTAMQPAIVPAFARALIEPFRRVAL